MSLTAKYFLVSLTVAILLTGFYAGTAIVQAEGEMSEGLVVKPRPGIGWLFGGGEEGWWERAHPHEPTPWWLLDKQTVIVSGSWEESGSLWWDPPYFIGLFLTPFIWLSTVVLLAVTLMRRRK